MVFHCENALVVQAQFATEVGAATGFGGRDEVAGGEARGVVEGGEGDCLGEVGRDGDDGDAGAGEN